MTNVHRIHLQSGRFQIDLHVHDGGLVSVAVIDLAAPKRRFDGTLGSLMQTVDNAATFRDLCDPAKTPSREAIAEDLRQNNKVLRGLLRETQFYSHNPDLDQRIEYALNGKTQPTESSTETDQDGK